MLTTEVLATITGSVVALTQLAKWSGLIPLKWAPLCVVLFAAIGVGAWGWAHHDLMRETLFAYFTGGVMVALSAAGVYGFARSDLATAAFTGPTLTKTPTP